MMRQSNLAAALPCKNVCAIVLWSSHHDRRAVSTKAGFSMFDAVTVVPY
jgi:hypothetical protein